MRYDATQIMGGVTEVLAYGAAAQVERAPGRSPARRRATAQRSGIRLWRRRCYLRT